MPTRAPIPSRRRPIRAVEKVHHASEHRSLLITLVRVATGRPARAAYVALGVAGLAVLTVAIVGPRRLERDVLKPLRGAIEPQAEKLWADSRQLREQITGMFKQATPTGRAKLARSFQSWIGHFHAS